MEKHSESRLSYLFAHLHLLSSDLFSSDSSHLCFSTVHIVGSIASKLPSMMIFFFDDHYFYDDYYFYDDEDEDEDENDHDRPRTRTTLCASLRSRNALTFHKGHF